MTFMKPWISALSSHPTGANLLMVLFLLLGLTSIGDIRRETFPDFASTKVSISAAYPGATAEDVEASISERIEEAVESVSNITKITSKAQEGLASVTLEMRDGADSTQFLNDIKTEVEAISNFPSQVEDLIVKRLDTTDQVISVAISGPMSESHLKLYCEEIKAKIKQLPLVSQVDLLGFSDHQILIEVPNYQLMRLGISISDIQSRLQKQSLDLPAGTLETTATDYLLRFTQESKTARELGEVAIASNALGSEVKLGEIAHISNRFENKEDSIFINGKRAGLLQINKNKSEDALKIRDQIIQFIHTEEKVAPPEVEFVITQDVSKIVKDRLQMITINGLQGLLLVFLVLWLFFNFRMSFWVAMGLPVSFCMTFFFMKQIGFSFNMLSMVGLLIAIGILMDDAIVIVENVAAQLEKGKKPLQASIDGVSGVAGGVWSSFLTTLFIFGSLALSMQGDIGKVLYAIPVVLIITLSVSMVEAFAILPNHLSHSLDNYQLNAESGFRKRFENCISWVRDRVVGKVVDLAVEYRYLFMGGVVFLFLASISLIAGGYLKVSAFPETEGDVLQARILLPQGTSLERTEKVVEQIIQAMKRVDQELTPLQPAQTPLVKNYSVLYNVNQDAGESGPHVATVSLDLLSAEERSSTTDEIINLWRRYAGTFPDVINIAFKEPSLGPGGLAIQMELQGTDLTELKAASVKLVDWLKGYNGVYDLDDNLRPGKPELRIRLNKGALAMGFTSEQIASQLRAAFYGAHATEIQHQGESYEVMVRLAQQDRQYADVLENFHIMGADGQRVPLQTVASIEPGRGYATITRINGLRTVTVTGDVDTNIANVSEIVANTRENFFPQLQKNFPNLKIQLEGQNKETRTSMQGMVKAFLFGILGVFIILSIQFRSYLEPFAVMIIIPFALTGVIWGHFLLGLDLTMPSIMGYVSLAGIVVNDSILLVTFIRSNMALGDTVQEAAKKASRERFRAVLLTSMTTIFGLLPLMAEQSMQAQILKPLACSIIFGLLATTFLVLLVIPALYSILDDMNLTRSR